MPKPGHYRVAVRPGGWLGTGSHLLEAVTEVRVPAGGPVANAVVHTRRGGRLRLVARSPGGCALEARCIIRDSVGQRVATEFHRDRIDGWWGSLYEELSDGPTDLHPPLVPGIYTVAFSHDDFATVTKTVRVDSGATTTVEATLGRP